MVNKLRQITSIILSFTLIIGNISVFAETPGVPNALNFTPKSDTFGKSSIGEKAGMDFFLTLDGGSYKFSENIIANKLKGKTSELNQYIFSNGIGCGKDKKDGCLDESKDLSESTILKIKDGNIFVLNEYIKKDYQTMDISTFKSLVSLISAWYDKISKDTKTYEKKMMSLGVTGLYQDGDEKNSGYDLIVDLKNIEKVIFTQETKYEGGVNDSNSAASDIVNGFSEGPSPVFYPNDYGDNVGNGDLGGGLGGGGGNLDGTEDPASTDPLLTPDKTPIKKENPKLKSESNKCNTGSDILGVDSGLLEDIGNQLVGGENSNSTAGGIDSIINPDGTAGGKAGGALISSADMGKNTFSKVDANGNSKLDNAKKAFKDTTPCADFICINISMTSYKQNLLGGSKSKTIEDIIDKNFKVINEYAGRSMIQSDMTKNFFSLSILRNLNLPSLAYLGIVVTFVPVPMLNVDNKSKGTPNEFKDETIFDESFKQNKLIYSKQNDLNSTIQNKTLKDCEGMNTLECINKIENLEAEFTPFINGTSAMMAKLDDKFNKGVDQDISEMLGFSNTFSQHVDQIIGTIGKMKKK